VAPWLWLFMVLRFFLGWACVSVVFSAFVLCMEVVGGGRWRTLAGVGFHYPVPLGYLSVAAMAYALPDWRHLQLAVALPGAALFVVVWALPESPRWLLAVGRRARLTRTLRKAAAANKRTLPDALLERACAPRPQPSAGLAALLRTPRMRRVALLVYVQWFALYLAYFGLVLNLGNVAGQIHLNTVLSGRFDAQYFTAHARSAHLLLIRSLDHCKDVELDCACATLFETHCAG
jgi:MFS transporter, OCT family, solute carrier family 22 (organic cation transporter), member 4/5